MINTKLYKVQVKTLRKEEGVYSTQFTSTTRASGKYKKTNYSLDEIDIFIVANDEDDIVLAIKNTEDLGNTMKFRSEKTLNNQDNGSNFIADFELSKFIDELKNDVPVNHILRKKIMQRTKNEKMKNNSDLDRSKKMALGRIGISGYVGVGVKEEYADGTKLYAATVRPKKGEKQIKIKSSKDPKICAEAYDEYLTKNNIDKPTNKSLGLI